MIISEGGLQDSYRTQQPFILSNYLQAGTPLLGRGLAYPESYRTFLQPTNCLLPLECHAPPECGQPGRQIYAFNQAWTKN